MAEASKDDQRREMPLVREERARDGSVHWLWRSNGVRISRGKAYKRVSREKTHKRITRGKMHKKKIRRKANKNLLHHRGIAIRLVQ